MRFTALLVSLLLALAACSDDSGNAKGKDMAVDTKQAPDTGAPDQGPPDGATDLALVDAALVDAALVDAALVDAAKSDATGDANTSDGPAKEGIKLPDRGTDQKLDAGNPLLYGTISRTVLPVNDGIGNVHISVTQIIFPFPIVVASKMIKRADLSKPGAKVSYQINATLASGTYTVAAWMDDNNNTWSPLGMAAEGDLVMSAGLKTTMGGGTAVKLDLALDKVSALGSTDGGVSGTMLKGRVTAKVVPSADGKGRLFFSLHSQVPPAGLVYSSSTVLEGCDLSTPFLSEAYSYAAVPAGKYYLQAFLDDNGNAATLLGTPNPDKGDMVTAKPVQVHVVSGQTTVRDVVLDALKN